MDKHKLRAVRLSRCNGDFRPRPGVKHILAFVGDRRAHHIYNGKDVCAALLRFPQCKKRIQRFAALADNDRKRFFIYNGIAVTELGGKLHRHWYMQHF